MSEMLRQIIVFLMNAEIAFKITKEDNYYIVYSPVHYGAISIWYIKDAPLMNCPKIATYHNKYTKSFVFAKPQEYIRLISDIEINLPV